MSNNNEEIEEIPNVKEVAPHNNEENNQNQHNNDREVIGRIINELYSEISNIKERMKNREKMNTLINLLPLEYSDSHAINNNNNNIMHLEKGNKWETCIIKRLYSSGIHKITFRRKGKDPVIFGIVKNKREIIQSGKKLDDPENGTGILVMDTEITDQANTLKNNQLVRTFYVGFTSACITTPNGNSALAVQMMDELITKSCEGKDINNSIKGIDGKEVVGTKRIENNDTVSLEINLNSNSPRQRTLNFYINDEQQPNYITGLPPELYFAVSLQNDKSSTEFVMLEDLDRPGIKMIENRREIYYL